MVDVEVNREFAGTCELELLGLPAGVVCEQPKMEVKNDTEQVVFPIKIEESARVGQHKSLVVRATITDSKGLIRQTKEPASCRSTSHFPLPLPSRPRRAGMRRRPTRQTSPTEAPQPTGTTPLAARTDSHKRSPSSPSSTTKTCPFCWRIGSAQQNGQDSKVSKVSSSCIDYPCLPHSWP